MKRFGLKSLFVLTAIVALVCFVGPRLSVIVLWQPQVDYSSKLCWEFGWNQRRCVFYHSTEPLAIFVESHGGCYYIGYSGER